MQAKIKRPLTSYGAPDTSVLAVFGLAKSFGAYQALADVSFQVLPGEILGLIGPNGAGKSTLLECLTGLLPADSGTVHWQGREAAPGERKNLFWYQPDNTLVYPDQKIRTTLAFFCRVHGAPASRREQLVRELDLSAVLDKPMRTLSKGYRRRVHLAVALLSRRPLLLLDEPFDGFDIRQSLGVMDLLRRFRTREGNRTLVLSIHQLSEAEKICDRFLLLARGRVLAVGTLAELCARAGLPARAGLEEVFLALT